MRRGRRLGPLPVLLLSSGLSWLSASAAAAPPAPPARGAARQLAELDADTAHRAALGGPLDKARQALARAHQMDQAGDSRHAALLRATAQEWLETARDLVRATDAEAKAEQAERSVDDLETKRARGRALLEETIARRGRAQALLEQLEHEPKAPAPSDTSVGAKKPSPGPKVPHPSPSPAARPLPAAPSPKPPAANE